MFKKLLGAMLATLLWTGMMGSVEAVGITHYEKFVVPDYWMQHSKNGGKVVLDVKEIQDFNKRVRENSRMVVDLASYPVAVNGDGLKTQIMNYEVLDEDLYRLGIKVSDNYKNILRKQTNVDAIPAEVKVKYALTVRRASVRNLPTGEGLFYYPGDKDFDTLQETVLDPGEPVVVLHTSANGYFYYVQAYNYSGWVKRSDLAMTDRKTWQQYLAPKKFLVVTDKLLSLKVGSEIVHYQMGAKLPFTKKKDSAYVLLAPGRNNQGNYVEMTPMISEENPAVNVGYLPYTTNNILKGAFKHYGAPYGWGGLNNSVDCSSLVANIYRSVGIVLPRNADQQEFTAGNTLDMSEKNAPQRLNILKELNPGDVIYMDGHCMLFLGYSNEIPYVIHSLSSHFSEGKRQRSMKVEVSDLALCRANGKTFMMSATTAKGFR